MLGAANRLKRPEGTRSDTPKRADEDQEDNRVLGSGPAGRRDHGMVALMKRSLFEAESPIIFSVFISALESFPVNQ
jgi:hypothetical protein